jgi:hypothetical protein
MKYKNLQDSTTVDTLVELAAVEVVWEENNSSGTINFWAVEEVGMFDCWTWWGDVWSLG